MMLGAGERVGPALKLPPLFAVLINPGVPVATPAVFKALGLSPGETVRSAAHPSVERGLGAGELLGRLEAARNDLEAPACRVAPEIADALDALRRTPGIRVARMSGSGATVFGLFESCDDAAAAAKAIHGAQPGWWVKATSLS
jgi:4-diphosphocytidyl-2-C-methyl-D-erythritol kinase